jgi:hypothetical protein
MNEAEWLACADPDLMLEFLYGRAGERKLRLCASAWARSVLRHVQTAPLGTLAAWCADPRWSEQLDAAERFADGRIGREALRAARQDSGGPYNIFLEACRASGFSIRAARRSLWLVQLEWRVPPDRELCDLHRCIFGNPFRPVAFTPKWRAPTVRRLAEAIYDERAFDRLPILADALEEAGCTDPEILGHCRGGGEHVLGCWLVDLILGKE